MATSLGSPTIDNSSATAAMLASCLDCSSPLRGATRCSECGRFYPEVDGILEAIGPLSGTNRIAATFYDGPGWQRFRPWERLFLWFQDGPIEARRQILRHLPSTPTARVLEIGIGDGENLPLLPKNWTVFGVDIARTRLLECAVRYPEMAGRLVWGEAEELPFPDGTFDAVYSIGGFNYFRDHAAALREIRRVARPSSPVLVADEIPGLKRFSLGHLIGFECLDSLFLRAMGLDPDFVTMVLSLRLDIDTLARRVWPRSRRFRIWHRLGYCLVDPDPRPSGCDPVQGD